MKSTNLAELKVMNEFIKLDSTEILYYNAKNMSATEDWKEKIIDKIKVEMKRQNMSQSQMAEHIGVRRTNVNNFLNMTNRVSLDRLVDMANVLGLDVDVQIKKLRKDN